MKDDNTTSSSSSKKKQKTDSSSTKDNNKLDPTSGSSSSFSPYKRLPVYGEHKRAVSYVSFAPSTLTKNRDAGFSCVTASVSADGALKIWDVQGTHVSGARRALTPHQTCIGHSRGINACAWNPVAPYVATASDDKTCRLWDAVTGSSLVEFRGHDNFVFCVDQHHSILCSGSFDETVKLWDLRSGDCIATIPAHSDPVTAVSFNRDGSCIASASHDGLIRIWDVATGECLKTIYAAGNPPVSSVKYSPNGKYLLAGTLDSTIRLWPVHRTGQSQCSKTYQCPDFHVNTKYSLVSDFLCDGNIVTGSESDKNRLVIYDVQTRLPLQILDDGHTDMVLAVSAHDKLPVICSGGMTGDRHVEFWMDQDYVPATSDRRRAIFD